MNNRISNTRVFQIICLTIMWSLYACVTPTVVNDPTTTPAVASIEQWVSGAKADSQISGIAVGQPNTLICRKPSESEQISSLDVYFVQPVIPSMAEVHAVAELPGNVKIQLLDINGNPHDVEYIVKQTESECPYLYQVTLTGYEEPVMGIRITSTGDFLENWNSIDAVKIKGIPHGATLDLSSTVLKPPPTPVPTATATPAPIGERAYEDRTDDYAGKYQLHVIYALFEGDKDHHRDTDGSIARSVKLANDWFKEQTGGPSLRFDTYQGELDITFVQFNVTPQEALKKYTHTFETNRVEYNLVIEDFYIDYIIDELMIQKFYQKGKYYIIYVEQKHPNYCGFSQFSSFPGLFFLGTQDCEYGRLGVDAYAWGAEFVMLHEVLHGIGFVPECAPHDKDNSSHVVDSGIDLMYPYAGAGQQQVLDVGNDDYFRHGIEGCLDLANSVFLEPLPEKPEVPPDWPSEYRLKE